MNRITKKFFALAVAVVIAISVAGQPLTFASGTDKNTRRQYDAMEVLRQLEIIPDYYDYNTNLSETVSRADFAAAAARAVKAVEYKGNPYYYDVSELHWAYKEISALTARGILKGEGNKLFRSDDAISKAEAYTIICSLLGYGEWAELRGGYPSGYMKAANDAEITDNVSSSQDVSVGDMFIIIINALKAKMMTSIGSETNRKYSTDGDETILSVYWNIYYNEGVLNGINGADLYGGQLSDGEVLIDKIVYTSDILLDEYFGERIEFFYESEGRDEKGNVIWASSTSKNTEVLNIDVNYDASFDEKEFALTYHDEESDRDKKVRIDKAATVVYNNGVTGENLGKILNSGKYSVKLISGGGSGYNTVIIRQYENYYVGGVNANDETIYESGVGLTYRELKLRASEYDNFRLSLYGAPKQFSDIKKGDVLSVYKSLDGSIIDVHIVTERIVGKIEYVQDEDHGKTIAVKGVEYFVPAICGGVEAEVNQSVTLCLDDGGDVAYIDRMTTSNTAAYITKMCFREGSDTVMCEMLLDNGELAERELNYKVTLDGAVYKNASDVYERLAPQKQFTPMFAMVKINSEDKVTMIDTVKSDGGGQYDVLRTNVSYVKDCAYNKDSLENYAVLNDSTVIFFVPSDERIKDAPKSFFRIGKKSNLTNWVYYNFESYAITERVGCEQYVVIKGSDEASARNRTDKLPMLVDRFYTGLDVDGVQAIGVSGYIGAEKVEMILGENVWEEQFEGKISNGDVIRIAADANNELQMAEVLFDEDAPSIKITAYNSTFGESRGYAHDLTGGILRISKVKGTFAGGDRAVNTQGVPCLIYDSTQPERQRISYGNIEQVRTYMDTGVNCSMVYEMQTKGIPKMFVVYLYPKMYK